MAEPSLIQTFGASASQTATQLIISKADLATVGLTANAANTAESLFVAIMLLAKQTLTDTNLQANPDQSISIVDSFPSLVTRNSQQYRQNTYSVNLQKLDTAVTIDPDDF